jgi:hypothetical protein
MPTITTEPHGGWSTAFAVCVAIGLASIAPKPATAADLGAAPPPPIAAPDDGWRFRFAPYGCATSLNGSSTVRGKGRETRRPA